jgi:hypothetical protein
MVDMVMRSNIMGSSGLACSGCRRRAYGDVSMDDVEDNANIEVRWCSWTRGGRAVVDWLSAATGLGRHRGWCRGVDGVRRLRKARSWSKARLERGHGGVRVRRRGRRGQVDDVPSGSVLMRRGRRGGLGALMDGVTQRWRGGLQAIPVVSGSRRQLGRW